MIDANGTRYHLLLGRDDWGFPRVAAASPDEEGPAAVDLEWDDSRDELTLRPKLHRFIAGSGDAAPLVDQRRGAGVDRFDNWYWIAADRRSIRVFSSGSRSSAVFWPAPATAPEDARGGFRDSAAPPQIAPLLSGLAVTTQHYLVAGAGDDLAGTGVTTRLLVFDLHGSGDPFEVRWPAELGIQIWDIARIEDGGAWLLDRVNRVYFHLDAQMRIARRVPDVVPSTGSFEPSDASAAPTPSLPRDSAVSASDAFPIAAVDPIAIEAVSTDMVLILDRGHAGGVSQVLVLRHERSSTGELVARELARFSVERFRELFAASAPLDAPIDFPLQAHDLAFVPAPNGEPGAGTVLLVSAQGNQALAGKIGWSDAGAELFALTDYLPMRLFGGRALVGTASGAYYDSGERFLPLIAQRRPRFEANGTLTTRIFDGKVPACVWHRLAIDAHLPSGTALRVRSRTAETSAEIALSTFQEEPPLVYRRSAGSELPFLEPAARRGQETWELLFQNARGRYLQLSLELLGDGVRSPSVSALRVWYPRFSYRDRYLPGLYRDSDTGGFLERFLANFEGMFTALEDRVAAAQALFDVRSVPANHLEWLTSWFGVLVDPAWDDTRRRLFLRHAMQFFQMRGTLRGLRAAVALATADCVDERLFAENDDHVYGPFGVRIVEHFRSREYPLLALQSEAPREELVPVTREVRWKPADGLGALLVHYGRFLDRYHPGENTAGDAEAAAPAAFPTRVPGDATASAWRAFVRLELGMPDLADGGDEPGWQRYLQRRYRTIEELRAAHGVSISRFAEAPYPDPLLANPRLLEDWSRYESVVRPMWRTAARFTVLVPVPPGGAARDGDVQRKLQIADRVVRIERPAHTLFDVRLYWAIFRVGQARLGHDSLIHLGGRAPELLAPAVLGRSYIAQSYVAWTAKHDASDRLNVGHDVLGAIQSSTPENLS